MCSIFTNKWPFQFEPVRVLSSHIWFCNGVFIKRSVQELIFRFYMDELSSIYICLHVPTLNLLLLGRFPYKFRILFSNFIHSLFPELSPVSDRLFLIFELLVFTTQSQYRNSDYQKETLQTLGIGNLLRLRNPFPTGKNL